MKHSQLGQTRKSRRATLLHSIGTVLAVGLLFLLFRQQGWDEIIDAFGRITFWRLVIAFTLTLISRVAVSGRWHMLLVAAGMEIPFWQTLRITFAGLFASHFLPTTVGGDVVRLGGVLRLGYARGVGVASLIVDRLIGMTGMAMAALTLLFQLSKLQNWELDFLFTKLWRNQIAWYSMSLVIPMLSVAGKDSGWLADFRTKIWHLIRRFGLTLFEWNKHPRALLTSLALTWVHMLCLFGSIWLFLPPLEEQMDFWLIGGLWSLTYFITLLPISVNGLGLQELSVTFFYTQLGGIQMANALTIALLVRMLQMFTSLPGALVIPGLLAGDSSKSQ